MRIVVYGVPIPQGSTRAFIPKGWTRPVITAANAKTKPWRQAIIDACMTTLPPDKPIDKTAPMRLDVVFYLPRPKSAPKSVVRPAKKPDLDKLVRAVSDALTDAGVWKDDAQVVGISAAKAFAGGVEDTLGDQGIPRAAIRVDEVVR